MPELDRETKQGLHRVVEILDELARMKKAPAKGEQLG